MKQYRQFLIGCAVGVVPGMLWRWVSFDVMLQRLGFAVVVLTASVSVPYLGTVVIDYICQVTVLTWDFAHFIHYRKNRGTVSPDQLCKVCGRDPFEHTRAQLKRCKAGQ